jgi:hypothetical protein
MNVPPGVTFEYGLDPHSARYYGVIRLPDGEFLTTGPNYGSVEEAETKAQEILERVLGLCATAKADR